MILVGLRRDLLTLKEILVLSLLEKDAQSFETTDANGLTRFKSGLLLIILEDIKLVTLNPDYRNSMDTQRGELRPIHKTKGIDLIEQATTDAQELWPVIKKQVT